MLLFQWASQNPTATATACTSIATSVQRLCQRTSESCHTACSGDISHSTTSSWYCRASQWPTLPENSFENQGGVHFSQLGAVYVRADSVAGGEEWDVQNTARDCLACKLHAEFNIIMSCQMYGTGQWRRDTRRRLVKHHNLHNSWTRYACTSNMPQLSRHGAT